MVKTPVLTSALPSTPCALEPTDVAEAGRCVPRINHESRPAGCKRLRLSRLLAWHCCGMPPSLQSAPPAATRPDRAAATLDSSSTMTHATRPSSGARSPKPRRVWEVPSLGGGRAHGGGDLKAPSLPSASPDTAVPALWEARLMTRSVCWPPCCGPPPRPWRLLLQCRGGGDAKPAQLAATRVQSTHIPQVQSDRLAHVACLPRPGLLFLGRRVLHGNGVACTQAV